MTEFLVWFIACSVSTFGFGYLYYKLSNCKKLNFKTFVIFIIGTVIITLIKYYSVPIISNLIFFLFYPILFNAMEHKSLKMILYYTLLIWGCGIILDFVIMLILSFLSYYDLVDLTEDFYIIFPSLIVFIIFIVIGNLKFFHRLANRLINLFYKLNYFDFLLIGFICFVFCIGVAITINIHHLSIDFLLILICCLILLSFILLVEKKIFSVENKIFLSFLKDNNNFYVKMDEDHRIFKHNLMAKMLSIKSVSNKNARILIDDLLSSFNHHTDFSSHICNIPYGLNGIIYEKVNPYLDVLDIKIDNQINVDIFKVLKARRYNVFVEKLMVALDNAIESSVDSVEKVLVINLYCEDDLIIAEVKNSFSNDISLDNLGEVNYSTKGTRRGLGLASIFRNKEATVKVSIVNNLFVSKISAKKNFDE